MPALAAIAAFAATSGGGAAIAGAATGAGLALAAHESAGAAEQGAEAQANAVNTATEAQTKANEEALAFSKQQAEQSYQSQETANQANYNQWVAQQQNKSTLGQMYGLPALNIPAFQPMADPNYTGANPNLPTTALPTSTGTTPGSTPSGATGSANSLSSIQQQVEATMKSIGLQPGPPGSGIGDSQYWAQQALASGTGWDQSWVNRITSRFKGAGGGTNTPTTAPTTQSQPGTLASLYTAPNLPSLYAPPGVNPTGPTQSPYPTSPYASGTLGALYAGY